MVKMKDLDDRPSAMTLVARLPAVKKVASGRIAQASTF
jgi:hypothetical protein